MIVLGISSAGSIRIAKYYSSKKIYRARKAGLSALLLAICFMFLSCLAFIIFRSDIPKLYVDDNETIIIASKLFIIAGLFQIFDGAQATGLGLLRGMNDVKYPTLTTFFSYWIISLSASYFFGFILRYDVIGVWIGFLLGLIFSAASLNSRFLFLTKINKL
jgi:MATE family multidrug resistance protein